MRSLSRDDVERLYVEHAHVVLRRARFLLGNDDDAEEILQEVFERLLTKPERFEGRSAVTTYLYSATTNAALNRMRNRKTRKHLLDVFLRPRTSAAGGTSAAETLVLFRQALAKVPPELAQVAVYAYVDEMTQPEIAALIGCAPRTVSDRLAKFHELARLALASPDDRAAAATATATTATTVKAKAKAKAEGAVPS